MGLDIAADRREKVKTEKSTRQKASHGKPVIKCSTCNAGNMEATKIGKFGGFLRFIGYLITIPSVIGVLFAAVTFFSFGAVTSDTMATAASDAEKAGAALGAGLGFGFAIFLGVSSLVGGLIGWLLLMKKKVFKCVNCGFILDRA